MGAAYKVRRGKARLWAVLKIDSSGHNLGVYSHFAHKPVAHKLAELVWVDSPDFAQAELGKWALDKQAADKLEGAELGLADCSTLDAVERLSAHKDCRILPRRMSPRLILNGRKTAVEIAAEQASQN